jgi:hypothetical protein
MTDGIYVMYHDDTPSVLMNLVKVAVCGSGVKRLKSTSHMPRNMVRGKPSNQSARGVDIPPTTRI